MSPRGRRPAGEDTRGSIVEAARVEFARMGYAATSLRAVARAAGVDPALVHHYFDGKPALFAEIVQVPADPERLIAAVIAGPRAQVGERLVRAFLTVWDDPAGQERFQVVFRSAVSTPPAVRMLREFIAEEIFGRVGESVGDPGLAPQERRLRAGLAASQMIGVATMRYVLRFPDVVEASPEDLVRHLGPVLQGYLVGPHP